MTTVQYANEEFKSYKAAFECAVEAPRAIFSSLCKSLEPNVKRAIRGARLANTADMARQQRILFYSLHEAMERTAMAMQDFDPVVATVAEFTGKRWLKQFHDAELENQNHFFD